MVAAIKPAQIPSQLWIKISYRNWKNRAPMIVKAEHRGHKILFPCKNGGQLKFKADLMLALNK